MEKITMKEKINVQKPDDLGLDISDLRYFLVMLLFSAVVFFLLISQRLTNTFDGLWNNTWFFGGYWQVVTGRWLWPVIDALRFGIQTEPFNSLLTLSMSALAVTLLRKFFTEKDSVVTYLAGMAVLASTVTEIQLSYRFQSPVFGCSFLFSVLAAEHVVRAADFRKAVVQGALLLVMSLACYQTSLDNFCLLLLTYLLLLLFRNVDREKVHAHIGRSLCSAAAGMVLYFLLTKLIVWACGWQMASYNGGADVSVLSILKNLPNAIAETYQLFGAYFFQNYYRHNILQPVGFFVLVFLALSIGLLNRFRKMLHRKNSILWAGCWAAAHPSGRASCSRWWALQPCAASRGCFRMKRMNDPLSQCLRHCQLPRKGELYCACPPEVKKLSLRESWRVSA